MTAYSSSTSSLQVPRSLTGDRPTGPLHLGHYVGSLCTRKSLEDRYESFVMIADMQALTDHARPEDMQRVKDTRYRLIQDYIASGLDATKHHIFFQSRITSLPSFMHYLGYFVPLERLLRNPTVKEEIRQKSGDTLPVNFHLYPLSQAADILIFGADVVPVGKDQKPLIEQTNDIVSRMRHTFSPVSIPLHEVKALFSSTPSLIGIDGACKASKTLGNAIPLNATPSELKAYIQQMYTDPKHIHIQDPGRVEGHVVFAYLDAFYEDKGHLQSLKEHYQKGGLGDQYLKTLLYETLCPLFECMHDRRRGCSLEDCQAIAEEGNRYASSIALETLQKFEDVFWNACV